MKRKLLITKRVDMGLSQEQLGRAIGISKQMVSLIENARCGPSINVAFKLQQFFGIPASELLAESEERQQR